MDERKKLQRYLKKVMKNVASKLRKFPPIYQDQDHTHYMTMTIFLNDRNEVYIAFRCPNANLDHHEFYIEKDAENGKE